MNILISNVKDGDFMGISITQINQDTYLLSDNSSKLYLNSTVIFTNKGPIIVDVFRDKEMFKQICNFINSKGWNKPLAIIYTHWHIDHTCGNQLFKNSRIISHKDTYRYLENFIKNHLKRLKVKGILKKDVNPLLPTETFENEIVLDLGNKTLRLIHSPGHTYDSILVYDVNERVLITGDNIIGKEVTFFMPPVIPPDKPDANHKDLEKTYEIISTLNPKTIIPGHGNLIEADKLLSYNKKRYKECLEKI
ncbi:MAG: MBL fold metallo-hydrolase [Firmicutes bacterium]|nr:MBL fold metallo-hydrolase [Bacillota bacterium]